MSQVIYCGPSLDQPIPQVTIPEFIRQCARQHSGHLALVDAISGRSYSYDEVDRLIGRFAAGLVANNFVPGDIMLMFSPNLIEWPIVALGALAAGGVVSGANPGYSAADLANQIQDSGAKFIFTVPELLSCAREASAQTECKTIIVLGDAPDSVSYASIIACQDPEPVVASDINALAALPYSSGTTGLPKGVMLTHVNLVSNVCQTMQAVPAKELRVGLAVLPMFHIYGFAVTTFGALARGATLIVLPRFEPVSFLNAIQVYRVNRLNLVPPLIQFLAKHPLIDSYDLSSVTAIGSGAAPLGAAVGKLASDRLKCPVSQGLGMTESSGVISTAYTDRIRARSCGQLLPATEARIVDPGTDEDALRGTAGEFWFRGPQAFKGYFNQPEASAATITSDGWVRSGDIGYFDDDGFLYITDRIKELIKVKGFQVAPAELEALLFTHPAVADVAVIGRKDDRSGEIPVAYIVGRSEFDAEEIKAWLAERVLDYKQIGAVIPCEAIPKTASGKILRRVLRDLDASRAPD
jgi:acyl-CoA synthetase (AMP-forming)/AMP-acid ligase II